MSNGKNGLDLTQFKCRWKPVVMDYTLATKLLDRLHPRQRGKKRGNIDRYCQDMLEGKWRYMPHQCIGVDEDNFTMNGQNTLLAWLKAYATDATIQIPMVICYGVPRDSMVTTDTGAVRNVNDAAKVQGLEFSNKSFSSVARRMFEGGTGYRSQLSVQKTLDLIEDYDEGLRFAFGKLKKNVKGLTQGSVRAVVARAYYTRNKFRLEEFCEMLLSGLVNDRNTDSAVITLRNFLLEQVSQSNGRGLVKNTYGIIEQCLDAFLNKQRVFKLEPATEELFPLPNEKKKKEEES